MTPEALLTLFRSEVVDEELPYLWSDAEVKAYIEDAQTMYFRLTGGRSDATTTAVTEITVVADDEWVDTDERILKIKGAYRVDTGAPLSVLNYEDLASLGYRLTTDTGPVRALIIGMTPHKARLYPISNESLTIKALVMRLPLTTAFNADPNLSAFELDEQHHYHLLSWVKRCAYKKQDSQTLDKTKSEEFERAFRMYCEEARIERERTEHKPRSIVYGGI